MSATDFVVTIHALERMEERFPELTKGMSDGEQAKLMQEEVMGALEAGRYGSVPPVELAARSIDRWEHRKQGGYVSWTQDKVRGYVLQEDDREKLIMVTVIAGEERELAWSRRVHGKAKRAA